MTDWKKVGIEAISFIIGSGLILSGFNIFYNEFYNKPVIGTKWILSNEKNLAEIIISNAGRIAATHLTLTLQTPQDMDKSSPDIFSTVNVTKIGKLNPRLLQINVPTFATGDGSIIRAKIRLAAKPVANSDYVLYGTYDQGSFKLSTQKSLNSWETFAKFWSSYWIPIILIVIGFGLLAVVLYYVYHGYFGWFAFGWLLLFPALFLAIYDRFKKSKVQQHRETRLKSVSDILYDILEVRRRLTEYPLNKVSFFKPFYSHKPYTLHKWHVVDDKTKLKLFNNNMSDYITVDNFYTKIATRESLLSKNGGTVKGDMYDYDLKNLNIEILNMCENCLIEMDWTKYK